MTTAPAHRSATLADDDLMVRRLVDEVMDRVPAATDRGGLEAVGRRAVLEHRRGTVADRPYADTTLVMVVRSALTAELRRRYAGPRGATEVRQPAGPFARVADLVTGLPDLQRRVVAGYFIEDRGVDELSDELGLTAPQLAEVRDASLRLLVGAASA